MKVPNAILKYETFFITFGMYSCLFNMIFFSFIFHWAFGMFFVSMLLFIGCVFYGQRAAEKYLGKNPISKKQFAKESRAWMRN